MRGLRRPGQWGIATEDGRPRQELVNLIPVTSPQYSLSIAEEVPCEADPRLEILVILVDGIAVAAGAEPEEGVAGGKEIHGPINRFGGRHVPFPAQAQFQRKVGQHFEAVLSEQAQGTGEDSRRTAA